MSKRIALICDPGFLDDHIGVRNYIYSLARLLGRCADVDFISYYISGAGTLRWYRLTPHSDQQLWESELASDEPLSGTCDDIIRGLDRAFAQRGTAAIPKFYRSQIGSDLGVEDYDVGIITCPWVVRFEARLPVKRLVGFVHDIVPNSYVFTRAADKPFEFAAKHCQGFRYYADHCDAVIANSVQSAISFHSMFRFPKERMWGLPPMLPAAYHYVPPASNERNRQVVLAGPFDIRKGVKVMPGILNAAAEHIGKLSIYGGIRIFKRDLVEFFRELKIESIEWYPDATSAQTRRMFRESKVMLFPSFDEGLGFPILEAQSHGCRIMVRDKRPMSDLAGPGSRFVEDNPTLDGKTLAAMVCEPFDHVGLQRWSSEAFSLTKVLEMLSEAFDFSISPKWETTSGDALIGVS